jgi:tripartite-type tricarboxylate transporter receptor subunit TctC
MWNVKALRLVGAATLLAVVCGKDASFAAGVEDFYKGRVVTVVVGYTSGGGYDAYARVLARYMSKHIPGNPTIVAQNMPGAGSLKAANYLYFSAPKDGSVFGIFGRGMLIAPLLGEAKFDSMKFTWLGSITNDVNLCLAWHQSAFKTWDDMFARQFVVGGQGSTADPDIFARSIKHVMGANIKIVTGYPGTSEITLAMQRGEVDGICGLSFGSAKVMFPDMLRDKQMRILVQAALKKAPELPDTPLLVDYVKTDRQMKVLKLVLGVQGMARPFVAPPDIPDDRKAALRKAFSDTMMDPDFLAGARSLHLEVNPSGPDEIMEILQDLYATPKEAVEEAKRTIFQQ